MLPLSSAPHEGERQELIQKEQPKELTSLQQYVGGRIRDVWRGAKEIGSTTWKRGKTLAKKVVTTGLAAGTLAGATGCMNVPDLPASAFTVLVDDGKPVQKRTCTSYVHFFDKEGVHYSQPGIIFTGTTPPQFGDPYDILDLELDRPHIFGTEMTKEEAWKLLQELRAQSLSHGKVPREHLEQKKLAELFIETRYNVLTTLYGKLQQRFAHRLFDCQDPMPNGAYPQLFLEEFARHHGLFANIDEEVGKKTEANVELVIGKRDKDIELDFTKKPAGFVIQQDALREDNTLLGEIDQAVHFLDDTLERIPDLRRFMKKPDTIRMQTIVDAQKKTNTAAFFKKGVGIVLYDDGNSYWRPSILFHELVHAYDAEKSDEQGMKTVQHEEREIAEDMPRSARKEFLALALEALYHQKYSSPTDRMRWIWHQLEQKTTPSVYQEFRIAVFTFTKRYLKEYPQDPVEDMITQHDPLNIKYAMVYQQEEYWELLGKFMEKLMAQLPLEEE